MKKIYLFLLTLLSFTAFSSWAQTPAQYLGCIQKTAQGITNVSNLVDIAKNCQGVEDLSCIDFLAQHMGSHLGAIMAKACQTTYPAHSVRWVPDTRCRKLLGNGVTNPEFLVKITLACKRAEMISPTCH